jgi:hypothetical protein
MGAMTAFSGSIPGDFARDPAAPGAAPWARRVNTAGSGPNATASGSPSGSTEGSAAGHAAGDPSTQGRTIWGNRSAAIDPATRQRLVRRLEKMAWLLDTSLGIPGTRFRLGLDAGLGLVPVVGDVVSALLSAYIIFTAWRLGARWPILALMVLNVLLDVLAGAVPVVGDIADVFVKANLRNIRLLGLTARW